MTKFAIQEQALRRRTVGRLLKTARERAGMPQSEVAKKLGYSSPQFVSNWERGVSLPPLDQLRKLITLLNIPPKTLIDKLHRYQVEHSKLQRKELVRLLAAR